MKTLLLHYDVADEQVLLETFVAAALSAQRVVNALNTEFFGPQCRVELVVLAPDSGTLKQYLGIIYRGVIPPSAFILAITQFLDSQSIREISTEAFGIHPTEAIVERIREYKERKQSDGESEAAEPEDLDEAAAIAEDILSSATAAVLQVERSVIEESELGVEIKYELALAQSELYEAVLNDEAVKGIGFDEEDEFPVPRHEFARRAVRPERRPKEDGEEDWEVTTLRAKVTSPNFEREDQNRRKWRGQTDAGSYLLFEILDEEFWGRVRKKEITFSEGTRIEIQVATKTSGKGPRDRRVLRVLAVDGNRIAEELPDAAISAMIGSFRRGSPNNLDPGLFDEL